MTSALETVCQEPLPRERVLFVRVNVQRRGERNTVTSSAQRAEQYPATFGYLLMVAQDRCASSKAFRKRGIIATDVKGLVISVLVVAASVHDNAIGIALLDKVTATAPTVAKVWVDAGFKEAVVEHGARLGIDVEIIQRKPATCGFTPQPKRWLVEQTLGTLMLHRRLARDYETRPASSVAWIHWSMTGVMLRRLTRTTTATWRDPPGGRHPHRAGAPKPGSS
ncbi:transposase [Streptomyces sp. NPDC001135]